MDLLQTLRLLIAAAIVLAWLLAMRRREHRPVALALPGVLLLDLAGERLEAAAVGPLAMRLSMALSLGAPALSAWCALQVFSKKKAFLIHAFSVWAATSSILLASWLCRDGQPPRWWHLLPPLAHGAAVLVQLGAVVLWARSPRPGTVTHLCAIILLAGDVIGLLGPAGSLPGPWSVVNWQAGVIAAALVLIQAWALRTPPVVRVEPGLH